MTSGSVTFKVTDKEGNAASVALPYSVTPTTGFYDDFTLGFSQWNVRNQSYGSNNYAYYMAANCTVQADGLHLTAKRQTGLPGQPSTKPYSSGYVDTVGKFARSTGLWEFRDVKLPTARGLWPALWLRSETTLGEIDVLEDVDPLNEIVETVHQSTNGDMDKSGFEYKPAGFDVTKPHTYGLRRDADGTLTWLIDNVVRRVRKPTDLDNQGKPMTWLNGPTFTSPLNIRINLQVGGAMPKSFGLDVDSTTVLPDDFVVGSVRWTPLTN